jgi:hypothetical protein
MVSTALTGVWEYSVRQYLKGFSDAIIPEPATKQEKAEAILAWMLYGPPRNQATPAVQLSPRDPEDTLNYRQLLDVCGSATNAFLNLTRSAGVESRRLLLLTPQRTAKHVVAEVNIDGRWVVADATYRTFLKDAHGNLLTLRDLQNPELFHEATSKIPRYGPDYTYEHTAHIRISALPFHGLYLRQVLDHLSPGWDESVDWSLLLERRSFAYLFFSVIALISLLLVRSFLAWMADHRLRVPRFRVRANLSRATAAFFTSPEIK